MTVYKDLLYVQGAIPAADKITHIPWLRERLVFLTEFGSRAYGTTVPDSDEDLRGIAIPPLSNMFGFGSQFEQYQQHEPDLQIYDLRKFMRLAVKGNPAILEVLFTHPSSWLFAHQIGKDLVRFRDEFVSQEAVWRFQKYALSRLPEIEKTAAAGAAFARNTDTIAKPPDPNPKRAGLIVKYGYDTKEAMHAVRIIRMAKEMVEGKGVVVRRPDAEELVGIREGSMTYDQVIDYVKIMAAAIEDLVSTSKLPKNANREQLDSLCETLVTQSFAHQISVQINGSWKTEPLLYGEGALRPKNLVKD